ncbi:hypothetical protein ANN_22467 [Periplaneta americana]|uniref:Reverse transcriptase domain-containing protein n=1 Tax=Periplaneta americana TaxID=6978 RepID=A0ABQ8S8D3_PERAM|nr:hypothetical protein ANN_22467 [Periplaneta americana]
MIPRILTLREEQRLRIFENMRDEVPGEWRKLHNAELHALYSSPDIIEEGLMCEVTVIENLRPYVNFRTTIHRRDAALCLFQSLELKQPRTHHVEVAACRVPPCPSQPPYHNIGRVIVGGRRIKCIRFANDMALVAEEQTILRDVLVELNDSCEEYGLKINANKTKKKNKEGKHEKREY